MLFDIAVETGSERLVFVTYCAEFFTRSWLIVLGGGRPLRPVTELGRLKWYCWEATALPPISSKTLLEGICWL